MAISSTRHPGATGSYCARNSLDDAKTAAAIPAERSKRERAFRTAASSSTTNTVGLRGGSISHSVITASFRARGLEQLLWLPMRRSPLRLIPLRALDGARESASDLTTGRLK